MTMPGFPPPQKVISSGTNAQSDSGKGQAESKQYAQVIPQLETTQLKLKPDIQANATVKPPNKIVVFFLKFASNFFNAAQRKYDELVVHPHLDMRVRNTENQIRQHQEFKLSNTGPEVLRISSELFLEDLKAPGKDHDHVANQAIMKGLYLDVQPMNAGELGTIRAFAAGKENAIIPTCNRLGLPETAAHSAQKNHLENVYVIEIKGKPAAVIRSGRIDTKERANEFVALIKKIQADLKAKFPDLKPLRIVSQQVNTFEVSGERKIIKAQHRLIAAANQELKGIAEVVHINVPSNRFVEMTTFFTQLLFKGEKLSKEQNIESWEAVVRWTQDDIQAENEDLFFKLMNGQNQNPKSRKGFTKAQNDQREINAALKQKIDENIETIEAAKDELKHCTNRKEKQERKDIIKNANAELVVNRKLMRDRLIADFECFKAIDDQRSELLKQDPNLVDALDKIALMRKLLAQQLDMPGEKKISRGNEGLVIQQLLNRLGATSALNCKSGLDRSGFWFATKLAMESFEKNHGVKRLQGLVVDWDPMTKLLNQLTMKVGASYTDWITATASFDQWKKLNLLPKDLDPAKFNLIKTKLRDVAEFRNQVLCNLIKIGIPITGISTGVVGMKWNKGFQENLIPLNFLPCYVQKDNHEFVQLLRYDSSGTPRGMENGGRQLITKFQSLRGS